MNEDESQSPIQADWLRISCGRRAAAEAAALAEENWIRLRGCQGQNPLIRR